MIKRLQRNRLEFLCVSLFMFMLAFIIGGCGSKIKAELEKSTVSSTMLPMNKEAQIVAIMVNEAYRREIVATLYAQAVASYDTDKGTPAEYDALLRKTAEAHNRAYKTSQVALYLAGNLMNAMKQSGYATFVLPEKKEKLLSLETLFFSKTYAAYPYDNKSYSEAERLANDIMSAGNGKELTDRWAKLPPEERLERIAKYLHKDKKTARDVWQNIYNEKHGVLTGANANANTLKEVSSDVAYRTSAVLKTAGKVAKTVIATKVAAATGGTLGGVNVIVKTVDTSADAANTIYIVFTGDESEFWSNAVACTETADSVTSIFTGGPDTNFEKAQALAKGKILKLGEEGMARLIKYINALDKTEEINKIITVADKVDGAADGAVKVLRIEKKKKDDGSTEMKATTVDANDPKLEDKLEDLGIDKENVKEIKETAEKVTKEATKEETSELTSSDYTNAAESVEQEGFDTKEAAEAAVKDLDEANKEIIREAKEELKEESSQREGTLRAFPYDDTASVNDDEQDAAFDKALEKRSEVDEQAVDKEQENKEDNKGEDKEISGAESGKESGEVSGNDTDPPYAIEKVIGASYSKTFSGEGITVTVSYRVIDTGGWIAISCTNSEGMSFIADVTSYDPITGVGIAEANGEAGTFRITGEPGNMVLHLGDN